MTGLDKFVRGEYAEPEPQPLTRESVEMAIEKMTTIEKVPPYDYTRTQRSRRRKAQLDALAQAHGFASWSALETACINGAALAVGEPGAQVVEVDDPEALAADIRRLYLDNPAQHPR